MKLLLRMLLLGIVNAGFDGCSERKTGQKEVHALPQEIVKFNNKITIVADSVSGIGVQKAVPRATPPSGMVWIPEGVTLIGSAQGLPQEQPEFWVSISPFFMDEHPVTVADFAKFVKATGYQTQAEQFGDAGVFDEKMQQWTLQKGANWQYPQGPNQPKAPQNHPVTQVSWNDASAYARWAGKRLPSEIEWEHAARNARNDRAIYPFGNSIKDQKNRYNANIWQGKFPEKNLIEDGFRFTSPVGFFGKTPLGLTDMTGNVWEWCEDWKSNYAAWTKGEKPTITQEKAQRGGSFLCEPGWCHGYRVSGRSFSTPETALMHVGFRCVKDI